MGGKFMDELTGEASPRTGHPAGRIAARVAGALGIVLALSLLAAAGANAVVLSPTNFPLTGSNFQGGDGNQANPTALADSPIRLLSRRRSTGRPSPAR